MKTFFQRVAEWFSPLRREKLQAAVAGLAPVLVGAGLLTDGAASQWVQLLGSLGQIGAAVLALANLNLEGAADWFAVGGRATLYAAVVGSASAASALGFLEHETAQTVVALASVGLSALAAVISVAFLSPNDDGAGSSRPAGESSAR